MKDILTAPFVEEMKKTIPNSVPLWLVRKKMACASAICFTKKRLANTLLLIM